MPENNQVEALRLFELDADPTPAEQVDVFIKEYTELFEYTSEAWTTATTLEKSSLARFADATQQNIERNANPKTQGWRIFEANMMTGRNQELTELDDRLGFAKVVAEEYCEQAVAILGGRFSIGSRIGNRIIQTREELQTLQHSILSQAEVACAYGMAFFAQTEAKRRLAQLAENPETAEAFLDRIKTEANGPERTPGLLEIIATDLAHQPDKSTVYTALATKYADTLQQRVQILRDWLKSEQVPKRLRQETAAVVQFAQWTGGDIYAEPDTGTTAIERYADKFEHWPASLQSDYKNAIFSQRSAELKAFVKLLDNDYIRRSRLPDTRSFRTPKGKQQSRL